MRSKNKIKVAIIVTNAKVHYYIYQQKIQIYIPHLKKKYFDIVIIMKDEKQREKKKTPLTLNMKEQDYLQGKLETMQSTIVNYFLEQSL